eukprot:gene37420-45441_t
MIWVILQISNFLLMPEDYPKAFRGYAPGTKKYAHPDDYKEDNAPVKPENFLYKSGDGYNRKFFIRVSFRTTPDGDENVKFTSATFLDTGCCHDLEVCEDLGQLLTHRWKKDSVHDYIMIEIENDTHMCYIKSNSPEGHKPVNVMGLPLFFALGLQFHQQFYSSTRTGQGRLGASRTKRAGREAATLPVGWAQAAEALSNTQVSCFTCFKQPTALLRSSSSWVRLADITETKPRDSVSDCSPGATVIVDAQEGLVDSPLFLADPLAPLADAELADENLLLIVKLVASDRQCNTLAWKCLGYTYHPHNQSYSNEGVFRSFRA